MDIVLPQFCLVLLIGASGCGKSTFARRHFRSTEVVSSDACRALVSDDENNQAVTRPAFEVLHTIVAQRLSLGRLTVVDATNVQPSARQPLIELARQSYCPLVALVLDLPEPLCIERNLHRPNRKLAPEIVRRQAAELHRGLPDLAQEGFAEVYLLRTPQAVDQVQIHRRRSQSGYRNEHGPFDIIGDLHGCADELEQLLARLGYEYTRAPERFPAAYSRVYFHPAGRKAIFVGDLVDRGPRILDTYQLVRHMVLSGSAFCVQGNHDEKLARLLRSDPPEQADRPIHPGVARTLAEVEAQPEAQRKALRQEMAEFLGNLPSHLVLDRGRLVVAHAGIRKAMIGRETPAVRAFTLSGENSAEDENRSSPAGHWAETYRGRAIIVYGHAATAQALWLGRTINIDTGCVYGGALTALRYPELTLISVPALRDYYQRTQPLVAPREPRHSAQPPAIDPGKTAS